MRSLLYEAATSLICHVTRFSPLKSWAMRLAARKGCKKAAVATARKIALVLHCIWVDGTELEWTKKEGKRPVRALSLFGRCSKAAEPGCG